MQPGVHRAVRVRVRGRGRVRVRVRVTSFARRAQQHVEAPLCWVTASIAYGHRLNSAIETNKLGAPVVFDFKAGCPAAER